MIEALPGKSDHDRLFELILRLSSRIDQPTLLEDILLSVSSFWNTGMAALLVAEGSDGGVRLASRIGISEELAATLEGRAGAALLAFALRAGQPRSLRDLEEDPEAMVYAPAVVPPGVRDASLLPLVTPAGVVVGALVLYYRGAGSAPGGEPPHFTLLGPLLAQYIFTARAHAAVKRAASRFRSQAKKLNGLAEACAGLMLLPTQREILRRAASLATTWLSAEGCTIDLLNGARRVVMVEGVCRTVGHRCAGACSTPSKRIRAELLPQLVRTRAALAIRRVDPAQLEISSAMEMPRQWPATSTATLLYLPLIAAGELVGAMAVVRKDLRDRDTDEDLVLAAEIARHTALALLTRVMPRASVVPQ